MDKVRKRDIKLSDYNISKAKYNELKYFCIQYREKRELLAREYGLKAVVNDGMPKSGELSDSTAKKAIKITMLKEEIELIEKTAQAASQILAPWILKNVTEEIPYEWLNVPCGRRQFYEYRRYFFYLLAQKR